MLQAPAIGDLNGDKQPDIVVTTQDGWVRAYTPAKQAAMELRLRPG